MRTLLMLIAIVTMTVEAVAQCPTCRVNVQQGVVYPIPTVTYSNPVVTTYQGSVVHQGSMSTTVSSYSGSTVNRDSRAYAHAQAEAELLARTQSSGHPYGVAPGCSYSGTGTSFSSNSPNHCFLSMPLSRLVARAKALGRDGKWYWSAHYR